MQCLKWIFLAALWALSVAPSMADDVQTLDSAIKLFDGRPKTIVVNGYSTSFRWPSMLQRKLDNYFEGKRVIQVKKATKAGTPIAKWIDVKTGKSSALWNDHLKPALQDEQGRPVIVLAQQSLQWVFGHREIGIRGADDQERIRIGADAIRTYVDLLRRDGADAVFIAMHIYKAGMEPQIGNERLALAEYLKSEPPHVHLGPDVWEPTKRLWPQGFAADQQHPNAMGAEVMAQLWFEALLKFDGRDIPQWSREESREAIRNSSDLKSGGRGENRPGNLRSRRGRSYERISARYDANKDGAVDRQEFPRSARIFQRLDRNGDGQLTKEDF